MTGRRGVVLVHGVGQSRQSDTLIDFGGVLLGWVSRAYAAQHNGQRPEVGGAVLAFNTRDQGAATELTRASLRFPDGQEWVLAEAWWASSLRPVSFVSMLAWSFMHLWNLLLHLVIVAAQRLDRLLIPKRNDPPFWTRLIDLLQTLGMLPIFVAAALAGYALLIPIFIIAQIPIQALQDFVLVKLLQPFLQYNAAAMRLFVEDDIQSSNMRRRVADAVTWLTNAPGPDGRHGGGCDDVVILAHSGGAMVSYGMLIDPAHADAASKVRKLITFGEGLNKAWELSPQPQRLARKLPEHIHWIDFWSSYDPAPAGWIDPPRLIEPGRRTLRFGRDARPWFEIFHPNGVVQLREQLLPRVAPSPVEPAPVEPPNGGPLDALRFKVQRWLARVLRGKVGADSRPPLLWPESIQVTNRMSILSDHGAYLTNDEQVVRRIAAEIDADDHQRSRFWCDPAFLDAAVERRRRRVAVLALGRILAVLGVLWAIAVGADDAATLLVNLGLLTPVVGMLTGFRDMVSVLPGGIGTAAAAIVTVASVTLFAFLGAGLVALVALVPYFIYAKLWDSWDASARATYTATAPAPALDPTPSVAGARQ